MINEIEKIMKKHFPKGNEYLVKFSYLDNDITKDGEIIVYAYSKNAHKTINRVFDKCFKHQGCQIRSISYC